MPGWWTGATSLAERLAAQESRSSGELDVRECLHAWRLSCGAAAAAEFGQRLSSRGITEVQLSWAWRNHPAPSPVPSWARFAETALTFPTAQPLAGFVAQACALLPETVPASVRDQFGERLRCDLSRFGVSLSPVEYPVLARLLATASMNAAEAMSELWQRLAIDRPAMVSTLLGGTDPGPVTEVRTGLGDKHQRGRSVCLLTFANGAKVVYKPRSLAPHLQFTELAEWLWGRELQTVPALACDGYGWLAHVQHRPCRTVLEADRFYYRAGLLMSLLYAVDAADIHHENVIACGSQPLVVDLETLFHPSLAAPSIVDDPAASALAASVARLLLLPGVTSAEGDFTDLSGLGGQGGANRPRLQGRYADPADHETALLKGFCSGYREIWRRKTELLHRIRGLPGAGIRIVARPTWFYAALLAAANEPQYLRDGMERDRLFDHLADASLYDPLRQRLLAYELSDLWEGDIPIFTSSPGSHDIYAANGDCLPGLLTAPGLDVAQAKLEAMSHSDLNRQVWIIQAALAPRRPRVDSRPPVPRQVAAYDSERLLTLAHKVSQQILTSAVRQPGAVNWLSLEHSTGAGWATAPMGAGLSDGYCGVALFLAWLGQLTGDERCTETARAAVAQLPGLLKSFVGRPQLVCAIGGGFAGLDGIAFAASHLATLLGEPGLREAALTAFSLADQTSPSEVDSAAPAGPEPRLGWCHGAAGVLLSGTRDSQLVRLLANRVMYRDLSLCHGELGMTEALLSAAEYEPLAEDVWRTQAATIAHAIDRGGPVCGTPGGFPTPSLLRGWAGIGYQLLRLGFPDRVPSLLAPLRRIDEQ